MAQRIDDGGVDQEANVPTVPNIRNCTRWRPGGRGEMPRRRRKLGRDAEKQGLHAAVTTETRGRDQACSGWSILP